MDDSSRFLGELSGLRKDLNEFTDKIGELTKSGHNQTVSINIPVSTGVMGACLAFMAISVALLAIMAGITASTWREVRVLHEEQQMINTLIQIKENNPNESESD